MYSAEAWTLRTLETHSLEVFEMRCLRAIREVTRADRMRNTQLRETLSQLCPLPVSSGKDYYDGLGMSPFLQKTIQLIKPTNNISKQKEKGYTSEDMGRVNQK